jgi:hypothetical protein
LLCELLFEGEFLDLLVFFDVFQLEAHLFLALLEVNSSLSGFGLFPFKSLGFFFQLALE